jgi:ubiquinone/menaquinone biosynthesis C-methylase UbiE
MGYDPHAAENTAEQATRCASAASPKESSDWYLAYNSEAQKERRRSEILPKLRKLGVPAPNRDTRILDLCCGNGETLDALYQIGFRHLRGLDIVVGPELSGDPRFSTSAGDAAATRLSDCSVDWVLIIHALHHLGPASHVDSVLAECYRILKPGGRLAIVDFPNSLQIRLAFWMFRRNFWLVTAYLKYFGKLVQEEWHFLKPYLQEWSTVRSLLYDGIFAVEKSHQTVFYYYLTLTKPLHDDATGQTK